MELDARSALAEALIADHALAVAVTETFFARHPEWDARFGPQGRRRCTEDARLHLSFLAGAVQAGSPALFAEYTRWCGEMLAARSIDRAHLDEHLALVEVHLRLDPVPRAFVIEFLRSGREALATPRPSGAELTDERAPLRLAYLAAAIEGKRGAAWDVVSDARRRGLSLGEVYREIFLWSQRRLGELWASATITVAAEHMASSVTQSVIGRLYPDIPGDRPAGRALIAGAEGELHVLPAQLAADLLEIDGWDVCFVGTNVPETSVLSAIAAEKPDVLGLSVTVPFNVPRTVSLVKAVRARFPALPIVLGGRAVRGAEALAAELGVAVDPTGDLAPFRALRRDARGASGAKP